MLDPHFKSLWVTKNYVGCEEAICVAFKYDVKIMIPLLMTCFYWFNPTSQACAIVVDALNS
jgi:hypothetical protein